VTQLGQPMVERHCDVLLRSPQLSVVSVSSVSNSFDDHVNERLSPRLQRQRDKALAEGLVSSGDDWAKNVPGWITQLSINFETNSDLEPSADTIFQAVVQLVTNRILMRFHI